jgi:glutamate-1-semialdehyde 2,1-aminomutase
MMLGLFEHDIFLNPMGTKLYLSLAHDEAACDEFASRLRAVLRRL